MEYTRQDLRAAVWGLREAGHTWNEIATTLDRSKESVRSIYRRLANKENFQDKFHTGRPSILSDRDRRVLVGILRKLKRKTATEVQKEAAAHYNINVSVSTVKRHLKKSGYVARVKVKKPYLTFEQKRARLNRAQAHKTWTVEDWKNVIWSDETGFTLLYGEGKEYAWVQEDVVYSDDLWTPTKKFGGGKLMVWGCITYSGVGYYCRIDETLDAQLYTEILRGEVMRTIRYYNMDMEEVVFQHDNDPKHTAQIAQDTLDELGLTVMDWPAQSPDLNPIEHYWSHVKRTLRDQKYIYSDIDELWEAVEGVMEVQNEDLCRDLIATMPERVQAIIMAKGGPTKY
jgi:transposase